MSKHDGTIGVMNRSEALEILGISKEQDDELQAKYSKGKRGNKLAKINTNKVGGETTHTTDIALKIEVLENKVKLIMDFLCI